MIFCIVPYELYFTLFSNFSDKWNRIGGVMVRLLASSVGDRGLEPRSGQTKNCKIGSCYFSAKHTAVMSMSKDWLARNQNNESE